LECSFFTSWNRHTSGGEDGQEGLEADANLY